jgi:hypothetical protein
LATADCGYGLFGVAERRDCHKFTQRADTSETLVSRNGKYELIPQVAGRAFLLGWVMTQVKADGCLLCEVFAELMF